jgi:regulatory protein
LKRSDDGKKIKPRKITRSYLENAGAYYLERFPASIMQFKKVMGQKIERSCKDNPEQERSFCLSLLDEVVEKFVGLGYLNDNSYAQALLHSLQSRGMSRMRILGTLRTKGVDTELIQSIMPAADAEQERSAALRWAKKKRLGPFCLRVRDNDMQRGMGSLARAGFGYDIAHWVMSLSPDEAQELL